MKVATFLADGFETVEALAVVDVLKRAGIQSELISITGSTVVTSGQGIEVNADVLYEDCKDSDLQNFDVYFLPGGPGHKALEAYKPLCELLLKAHKDGKRIAAICAAPSVLGHLGILQGKKATCFPGYESELKGAEVMTPDVRVITDGNVTTSRGMGTSIDLGLELVKLLKDETLSQEIGRKIQYL